MKKVTVVEIFWLLIALIVMSLCVFFTLMEILYMECSIDNRPAILDWYLKHFYI